MTYEELLGRLDHVRESGPGQAMARCPAHQDKQASLSVKSGSDQPVVLHCHAGCAPDAILAALGLTWPDVLNPAGDTNKPTRQQRRHEERVQAKASAKLTGPVAHIHLHHPPDAAEAGIAEYRYLAADSRYLFSAWRFPLVHGGKTFRQGVPCTEHPGEWLASIEDIERVLFHLPDLLASNHETVVLVVEGEKDVLTAESLGHVATSNPMGAGHWDDSYNRWLRARDVVIVRDHDQPGREHGRKVAASLKSAARSIRLLDLPLTREHADLSDWSTKGAAEGLGVKALRAELDALIRLTTRWTGQPLLTRRGLDFYIELYDPELDRWFDVWLYGLNRKEGMGCMLRMPATSDYPFYIYRGNPANGRERRSIAQELAELSSDAALTPIRWQSLLLSLVTAVDQELRKDRPVIDLDLEPMPSEINSWLIPLFLQVEQLSLIYGAGAAGKSMLCLYMAVCVAYGRKFLDTWDVVAGNVLYLDWECDRKTAKRRLHRIKVGLGISDSGARFYYRECKGHAIEDLLPSILKDIAELNIKVIIIDSTAYAAGPNAKEDETATAFANSVGQMEGVTIVAIAHVAKDVPNPQHPYGSIFFENSARVVWRVERKAGAHGYIEVELVNQKTSNAELNDQPVGVRIDLDGEFGPIRFSKVDLSVALNEEKVMNVDERILHYLQGRNSATLYDIAAALDLPRTTVGTALHERMARVVEMAKDPGGKVLKKGRQRLWKTRARDMTPTEPNDAPTDGATEKIA